MGVWTRGLQTWNYCDVWPHGCEREGGAMMLRGWPGCFAVYDGPALEGRGGGTDTESREESRLFLDEMIKMKF